MAHAPKALKRIAYIDWLRGFACLGMFQAHGYDSWLREQARGGQFFAYSQLLSTFPAPLFLFVAGISVALATERLHERGYTANAVARTHLWRGAQILLLGLLFRVQEFVLGQPSAPWTDLLRVDILNVIGVSVMMMALLCRVVNRSGTAGESPARPVGISAAAAAAAVSLVIAAATPLFWTVWRPRGWPWWLESYINGVHTFDAPQPWLFPVFPWSGFAFAGLAAGFFLLHWRGRRSDATAIALVGMSGLGVGVLGYLLDAVPVQVYGVYDFWHTSPNFFLIRVGLVSMLLWAAYLWCRRGAVEKESARGFSPLIEMGKYSLLIYWVHIEFVYGRLSILPKRGMGIAGATLGILIIFAMMTILAVARNRWRQWLGRAGSFLAGLGRTART